LVLGLQSKIKCEHINIFYYRTIENTASFLLTIIYPNITQASTRGSFYFNFCAGCTYLYIGPPNCVHVVSDIFKLSCVCITKICIDKNIVLGSGTVWGFPDWGPLAEDSALKLKGGQLNVCTVYLYSVRYSSPPPLWVKFVPGWPAISVSSWQVYSLGHIIWFGRMSDISQLALHYLAQREGQVGGCVPSPWCISINQCCGSRMFISDPGSDFFSIPDPGSELSPSRIPDPHPHQRI
jgi:hypothetical protein